MLFARRCLMRAKRQLACTLTYNPKKQFAKLRSIDCKDYKWDRQKFVKKLDKEIYQYQSNLVDFQIQKYEYFKEKGWKVTYIPEKTIFQYAKTLGQHEIRVITYVMNEPPNLQIDGQQLPEEQANKKKAQVGVYIRKIGQKKAFFTEVGVFRKLAMMMNTHITDKYMFEWSIGDYFGPNINAIPLDLKKEMMEFLYYFGLNTQMFIKMVLHAALMVDYEDQKWLINVREFWS